MQSTYSSKAAADKSGSIDTKLSIIVFQAHLQCFNVFYVSELYSGFGWICYIRV